ncbi:MAG: NAD-dependent epimerase/dehydratase family protein [Caldilineales bacterium]|nr:NAD-dependent epimerase/dehydratase family protein [Caldilineales bacterium]
MSLQGKRILVTGATGFIGRRLAGRLQQEEAAVVAALVRNPSRADYLADSGIEIIPGDITDADSLRRAARGRDIVYHSAAYVGEQGSREEVWAVNVEGTRNLTEACVQENVGRLVHLSSCAVYGSLQQMDIDERVTPRLTGRVYHDSKVEAETVIFDAHQRRGLAVVSARASQVYGLGSPQFTLRALQAVRDGKVILIDGGKHFFKPIYIDNLVDALVKCGQVEAAVGEALNITDGVVIPWRDFFAAFGRMIGVDDFPSAPRWAAMLMATFNETKGKLRGRPSSLNREVVRTFSSDNSFSNAKAKLLLDWEPSVDFSEGMRRTEAWLRTEGHLG